MSAKDPGEPSAAASAFAAALTSAAKQGLPEPAPDPRVAAAFAMGWQVAALYRPEQRGTVIPASEGRPAEHRAAQRRRAARARPAADPGRDPRAARRRRARGRDAARRRRAADRARGRDRRDGAARGDHDAARAARLDPRGGRLPARQGLWPGPRDRRHHPQPDVARGTAGRDDRRPRRLAGVLARRPRLGLPAACRPQRPRVAARLARLGRGGRRSHGRGRPGRCCAARASCGARC